MSGRLAGLPVGAGGAHGPIESRCGPPRSRSKRRPGKLRTQRDPPHRPRPRRWWRCRPSG